jgi:hypothetical protein
LHARTRSWNVVLEGSPVQLRLNVPLVTPLATTSGGHWAELAPLNSKRVMGLDELASQVSVRPLDVAEPARRLAGVDGTVFSVR